MVRPSKSETQAPYPYILSLPQSDTEHLLLGLLHEIYGAGAECLYLIRPDGYIGFQSQPAREDRLLDYLSELFLLEGAARKHTPERSTVLNNQ